MKLDDVIIILETTDDVYFIDERIELLTVVFVNLFRETFGCESFSIIDSDNLVNRSRASISKFLNRFIFILEASLDDKFGQISDPYLCQA